MYEYIYIYIMYIYIKVYMYTLIISVHSILGDTKREGNAAPMIATRLSNNLPCAAQKGFSRSDKNQYD